MSAATLRLQIERSLERRFPAALSPAARTLETMPTGIGAVDGLLEGGLPAGAITEIAGSQSSGRTSLALAFMARQTGEGRSCAWVDADDAFDPESAAASGVLLRQLLWVRCRGEAAKKAKITSEGDGPPGLKPSGFAQLMRGLKPPPPSDGFSAAEEDRSVCEVPTSGAEAHSSIYRPCGPMPLLQNLRAAGSSSACEVVPLLQDLPTSSVYACETRSPYIGSAEAGAGEIAEKGRASDEFGEMNPSGAKARVHLSAATYGLKPVPFSERSVSAAISERGISTPFSGRGAYAASEAPSRKKPWPRLEQAIRATDLLLQAGGFAAIVLDLGGTAAEHARRIPLATWFRFRQAAARTRCSLVVLGQAACAQSSAAAVLECAPLAIRDKGTAGGGTVLDGFTFSLRRSRGDAAFRSAAGAGRKLPEAAWPADCAWNAERRA